MSSRFCVNSESPACSSVSNAPPDRIRIVVPTIPFVSEGAVKTVSPLLKRVLRIRLVFLT